MAKLKMNWDSMNVYSREVLLRQVAMQPSLSRKNWKELDKWIKQILQDNVKTRSKNTVMLTK